MERCVLGWYDVLQRVHACAGLQVWQAPLSVLLSGLAVPAAHDVCMAWSFCLPLGCPLCSPLPCAPSTMDILLLAVGCGCP